MRKTALTLAFLATTAPGAVMAQQQQGQFGYQGQQQYQAPTGEIPLFVSPGQARLIEWALSRIGANTGNVDGVWDPQTVQAVRTFQQAKGLEPTGNLNLATLAALGLSLVSGPQHMAMVGAPGGFAGHGQQFGQQYGQFGQQGWGQNAGQRFFQQPQRFGAPSQQGFGQQGFQPSQLSQFQQGSGQWGQHPMQTAMANIPGQQQ